MRDSSTKTKLVCIALAAALASCRKSPTDFLGGLRGEKASSTNQNQTPSLPPPAACNCGELKTTGVAEVVARVVPSVVSISSTRVSRTRALPFEDPLFRFFFGPGGNRREQREQGLGSGVIVADGVIVTNNHVVDQAENIKVATFDNRHFDGKLVGADPKSDLAVIRISGNTSGLRPLPIGDTNQLRLGDAVLAIGNPFGVGQTVTMGIVSAKNRSDLGIEDYEDFIQTDAAINPGNSGGALVDMGGNLVGINTAILSRSGGNVGIGFAIPSNMARPIIDSLIANGKVSRGWLGVAIQNLDYDMANALKVPENSGVLVSDVTKGTPAERAGVRRGDVITSVDDRKVRTTGELRNVIAAAGTNHTVVLHVLREGKDMTFKVQLAEIPKNLAASESDERSPSGGDALDLGMRLQPLGPELRSRLDVPADIQSGVAVVEIDPSSDAARAGIKEGDVILELNHTRVSTPADLERLWREARGNVLALVWRKGSTVYLVIKRTSQ
jgi:Do/DeqQ family serine protease